MMRFLLLITMLLAGPALAVEPSEMLDDPVLEERARALSKGLRCLVCLNENIDDSNAGLAKDLRILLRERLTAGDSDAEAVQFIVDRYGEFVLLKPSFSSRNLVLWLTGPLLLIIGGAAALGFVRKRPKQAVKDELSDEEKEKLQRLLSD